MADRKALLAGAIVFLPLAAVLAFRGLSPGVDLPKAAAAAPSPTREAARTEPARTPALRGRILDAEGDAVAGAIVRLVAATARPAVILETTSDAAGGFAFVVATPAETPNVRVSAEHDPEGSVTSADLRLSETAPPADATLVLSPASVHGTVVDGDDRPVAGATLSLEGVPWKTSAATADAAGAFRFGVVPVEATSLLASANGYRSATAGLAPRDPRGELVIRVRLFAAPPVAGDVLDTDGKPARARVVACEGQPNEASTSSAEDGTFELPVSTIGCDAVARNDVLAPSDATTLVEGRRTVLRLKAGGSIEGVVVDDRGAGVRSFTLGVESFVGPRGVRGPRGGPRSFEDARGTFRLDQLAPGSYVLTATAPDRAPTRSDPIEVSSGAVTGGVRIVLRRGGIVVGHVFDDRHSPLADVDLAFDLVSSAVAAEAHAKTDAWGEYRIEGAPAGLFTLRVHKDGFRVRLVPGLRVDSGATLTQDIVLAAQDGGASFELVGIGAGLVNREGGITIGNVFEGDPAARAGLRAGDRIARIDGEDTEGMSLADAIQRLRGEPGTTVGVTVMRGSETIDVTIDRATIVH